MAAVAESTPGSSSTTRSNVGPHESSCQLDGYLVGSHEGRGAIQVRVRLPSGVQRPADRRDRPVGNVTRERVRCFLPPEIHGHTGRVEIQLTLEGTHFTRPDNQVMSFDDPLWLLITTDDHF